MNIRSYSSPKVFGHRLVQDVLDGNVVIHEKIDGSQISFGVYSGELSIRSRNQQLDLDSPGIFQLAVDHLKSVQKYLKEDWTYRGEFLSKPKHNTLHYHRTPAGYIVLFDIDTGNTNYLSPTNVQFEAQTIGCDCAPVLWEGEGKSVTIDLLENLLQIPSILGGILIEGVVIKNYDKYIRDKVMMAKYVNPDFQEKHGKDWKQRNPGTIEYIVGHFNREAIWQKAVQHLAEAGELEHEPKDIGKLMKELNIDIKREHGEDIKEMLYKKESKKIIKGLTRGFPEWYKEQIES